MVSRTAFASAAIRSLTEWRDLLDMATVQAIYRSARENRTVAIDPKSADSEGRERGGRSAKDQARAANRHRYFLISVYQAILAAKKA